MRRSVYYFALACLVFFTMQAHSSIAQLDCSEPNTLAFVFDNGDINFQADAYEQITARIVLINPSDACVNGLELAYEFPANDLMLLDLTFPVPVTNIGIGNTIIAGFSQPVQVVDNMAELATITFFRLTSNPTDIFMSPASPASIPGTMVHLDCDNNMVPMGPISRDYALPVARINGTEDLEYCGSAPTGDMMVQISALGDNSNFAGSAIDALDGYDSTHDQLDSDVWPTVYFPHPEWNHPDGSNFQHDIKSSYDPLTEIKQWTFVVDVEIDASGGVPIDVDLAFDPSFDQTEGIVMQLHDRQTGQLMELLPPYIYNYHLDYSNTRLFDLFIGTEVIGNELEVIVDVSSNEFSDRGNLAATLSSASDGYDAGQDIPKPGPAPANYLTGSFTHTDWPMGPRFSSDIRAPYDPLSEVKTWPFRVETDQSGTVLLDFNPNFDQSSEYPFMLKDMSTGQSYNLYPTLSFMYLNNGSPNTRDFELTIGGETGPPPLDPTSRQLESGWSIVGFPVDPLPGLNSLGDVILDQAPGYSYAFLFGGDQGYSIQDEANSIVPGSGYWIATDTPFLWTMPGDISLEPTNSVLQAGWNLVANPLWFPGPIEGILVNYDGNQYTWADAVTAGLMHPTVMDYNTAHNYYDSTIDLHPWHGYWFGAQVDDITLTFDWTRFLVMPARFAAPPALYSSNEVAWRTDFFATSGDDQTRMVTFGVNSAASAGFDSWMDIPRAPTAPGGGSELAILNPEWDLSCGSQFACDYIQPTDEAVAWNIEFRTDQPGEVLLSWTKFDWPADLDYQLYIPSQNRVVVMSMNKQSSILLPVEDGSLVVQVRTPDMLSGVGDLPGLEYSLSNSPNPFNPQTMISFSLVEAGDVELKIYTIRGEKVESLKADGLSAGMHKLVWRGNDRTGRAVPSGSYFVKMFRNGVPVGSVTKMSLIR